jgi:hypothetical protein
MRSSSIVVTALSVLLCISLADCTRHGSSDEGTVTALPVAARGLPGPFDGTWQVAAPGVRAGPGVYCGPIDLKFQIRDSQVIGGLKRSPYDATVVSGGGFTSAPMNGNVQPNGAVQIAWEQYLASGRITDNQIQLQWKGECGPRLATGTRVASAGAGSSTSPR